VGTFLGKGETVVVGIKDFSVLREVGHATRREKLAHSKGALKSTAIHRRRFIQLRQVEASSTAERYRI
jgi:hypothetical protein